MATALLTDRDDLQEERVAFLVTPGFLGLRCSGVFGGQGVLPFHYRSIRLDRSWNYLIDDTGASTLVFDRQAAPYAGANRRVPCDAPVAV